VLAEPELAKTPDERGMPAARGTLDEFTTLLQSETNGWKVLSRGWVGSWNERSLL
jgi:hypothetical protein